MEAASQIAGNFNPSVFLEPRGFIKILEFVLSIFAFATTTSPDESTTFTVANCSKWTLNNTGPVAVSHTYSYSYPYELEEVCLKLPLCKGNLQVDVGEVCLLEGSKSSAQFYVFVGVIVFLYCLATLVLYVFFDELYRRNSRIVLVDFIISCVLTLFWIISSSAWAAGVADVKLYTDPYDGGILRSDRVLECQDKDACHTDKDGNFASLNVSLIFGFLNFGVWIGNLWFLYKETPWFKVQAKPPTQPDSVFAISSSPSPTKTTPSSSTKPPGDGGAPNGNDPAQNNPNQSTTNPTLAIPPPQPSSITI